jgi:hypothetical protein
MNRTEPLGEELGRALDAALERTLRPPQPGEAFRRSVRTAVARAKQTDLSQLRAALESERRASLAALEADYVRVKRRTLGTLIGAAFGAGAAVALALPWLQSRFGADTPLVLASAGAVVGLAIAFGSWLKGDAVTF